MIKKLMLFIIIIVLIMAGLFLPATSARATSDSR